MADHQDFRSQVLLRGEQTDGASALVEITVPPRWDGPPLHHHAFAEAWYVLEGELTFQIAGERRVVGAGGFAHVEGDVEHTLANPGDEPAHYLLTITPAGFETYFDR